MYTILRNFLFLFNAEKAHYLAMNSLKLICKIPFAKKLISKIYTPVGEQSLTVFNLSFRNRIGLGAGFDKNARYLSELEALGFGFVEIGTVTPKPQDGNEKSRLFRLKKDQALINRMGFNNDGVVAIAERLKLWDNKKSKTQNPKMIIGGNIGKNKITPNEDAWKDYVYCFEALQPYVDYFVVNVSSPNTPGLRELQEKESLRLLFEKLETENRKLTLRKPILLKIAPDLSSHQVDDVVALALEINMDGLVVSNTTLDRSKLCAQGQKLSNQYGAGGLSGKPLAQKATDLVRYIFAKTNGQIPIIGSGGIFTHEDAQDKYTAGASLLQVWTGFIYEGPAIVKKCANAMLP